MLIMRASHESCLFFCAAAAAAFRVLVYCARLGPLIVRPVNSRNS